MDRVGGFLAYKALEQDMKAYEDVVTVIQGESDAAKIMEMERKVNGVQ